MSGANFMEKLLDGVSVEWRPLGALINTVTASSKLKTNAYRDTGKLPIVDQGIEFIAGYTDEDIVPIKKAVKEICDEHRAQLHNYLKATKLELGFIVNFGHYPKAMIERIVK